MNPVQSIKDAVKKIIFGNGDDTGTYKGPLFDHYEFLFGNGDDTGELTDVWFSTVDGGNGADRITVKEGRYNLVDGGNGDDLLTVRNGHSETLEGGNGNDTLLSIDSKGNLLYGDNGADALISRHGKDEGLKGGIGADSYHVTDGDGITITDSDSSAVVVKSSTDTEINLGDGDDTIEATAVTNSTIYTGGGFDQVLLRESGGGNTVSFGGMGSLTLDYRSGPAFINPKEADTINTGDGQVEILFQGPYSWDNVSGLAEIEVFKFDPKTDLLRLDWGGDPTFVSVGDEGEIIATFIGDDGESVFRASFTGIDHALSEGAHLGSSLRGVGVGMADPTPSFRAIPDYFRVDGGEGMGYKG